MKVKNKLIGLFVAALALTGLPATAHAGLWCEQAGQFDDNISGPPGVSGGAACSAAVSAICRVAGKLNGSGGDGCLQ